jgi:DNA-binding HxlR family transcriptional regulator
MSGNPVTRPSFGQAEQLVQLLRGRWTLSLLEQLVEGGRRYQDLHDFVTGISYKVLTETLRKAERDGLICREIDSARVESAMLYELTELGRSLGEPLDAVVRWIAINWSEIEAARQRWDQRAGNEGTR